MFLTMIVVQEGAFGQITKASLRGKYECIMVTDNASTIDTVGWQNDTLPIYRINKVELNYFPLRTLILTRCNRVKIIDNSPIMDIGLNVDNPTIYGRFTLEGDTIVIRAKYSIQHFNSLTPKGRVKCKVDMVYRFKILSNGQLQVNPHYSWTKIPSTTVHKRDKKSGL